MIMMLMPRIYLVLFKIPKALYIQPIIYSHRGRLMEVKQPIRQLLTQPTVRAIVGGVSCLTLHPEWRGPAHKTLPHII